MSIRLSHCAIAALGSALALALALPAGEGQALAAPPLSPGPRVPTLQTPIDASTAEARSSAAPAAAVAANAAANTVANARRSTRVKRKISLSASPSKAILGATIRLSGRLSPKPRFRAKVLLQQRASSGWKTIARARTGKSGAYHFRISSKVEQRLTLRVLAPGLKRKRVKYRTAVSRTRVVSAVSAQNRWINWRTNFVTTGYDPVENEISADGRYVAYISRTPMTADAPPVDVPAAYLWDRVTGTTRLVSAGAGAPGGRGDSPSQIDVSGDGRFVVYTATTASDTQVPDNNGRHDVILWDRSTNRRTLISANRSGNGSGTGDSHMPGISPNGEYVVFTTQADDLIAGVPLSGFRQIYRWKRSTGELAVVTVRNGVLGNGTSDRAAVSDGGVVAFSSAASNLVEGDTNGKYDVFLAGAPGQSTLLSVNRYGEPSNGSTYAASISADGMVVAAQSAASDLVEGDTNGKDDVFAWDLARGAVPFMVSHASGGPNDAPLEPALAPALSPDGRYVSFSTLSPDLFPGDSSGSWDTLVRELRTDELTVISRFPNGSSFVSFQASRLSLAAGGNRGSFTSDIGPRLEGRSGDDQNELFLWTRGAPYVPDSGIQP